MYDLTSVRRRYFPVRLKNGRVLDLEPPKLKLLGQMVSVAKGADRNDLACVDELTELFSKLLSKNKQRYRFTASQVREQFDWDEMFGLLLAFFGCLRQEKNDPN